MMTLVVWGLAFVGAVRRLRRGYGDATYVLLALAPFLLIALQSYGGEMLLRIYLFALPLMVFFAAALFYSTYSHETSLWMTAVVVVTSILLLGGFLFTRYGNERVDYITHAEVNGVRYLYSVAQPNSVLIEGCDNAPWKFQDYEKYTYYSMTDVLYDAMEFQDVGAVIRFIESHKHANTYLIFTRAQKAAIDSYYGFPPGTLNRLEDALLNSGKFKLIYSNPDAQIFVFLDGVKGGAS
jgi:hypothetical protein